MTAELVKSAWKVIPMFQSRSILPTVQFYTETLGFQLGGVHPDDGTSEPRFCSVSIGKGAAANFYFVKAATAEAFTPSKAMIALGTTELDEYYKYLRGLGGVVEIAEEIEDMPWGYRQFAIKDIDGNLLTFFKFLEGGNPGRG